MVQRTKEQVYDDEINPLMAQIIEICQEHKIAFVASFHCPGEGDDELYCTSTLLGGEYPRPKNLLSAYQSLRVQQPLLAFTITSTEKE